MSSFIIKMIAIITMTVDHINDLFIKNISLNIIGRISFPLFCFQLVVGYSKTKNLLKYITRMLIFALISQIPFAFFANEIGSETSLNVMFTLTLGLAALYVYDIRIENNQGILTVKDKKSSIKYDKTLFIILQFIKCLTILLIMTIAFVLKTDYGAWGILLILVINAFYPFKNQFNILGRIINTSTTVNNTCFLIAIFIMSIIEFTKFWNSFRLIELGLLIFFTFLPSIIMLFYNGKKGKSLKFFFYIYYPAQFIIILLINQFTK